MSEAVAAPETDCSFCELENPPESPALDLLRSERIPHIWCPGCGIGTTVNCFARALMASKMDLGKVAIVSGIETRFVSYQELPPAFVTDDILATMRGIVDSWKTYNESVVILQSCVDNLGLIQSRVLFIIQIIQTLDPSNVHDVINAIAQILWAIQSSVNSTLPCIDSVDDIMLLVDKVSNLTVDQFALRLYLNFLRNGRKINDNILEIVNATEVGDYYTVGYKSGEIVELLILVPPAALWKEPYIGEMLMRILSTHY
jgi:hypothetical protein